MVVAVVVVTTLFDGGPVHLFLPKVVLVVVSLVNSDVRGVVVFHSNAGPFLWVISVSFSPVIPVMIHHVGHDCFDDAVIMMQQHDYYYD